MAEIINLRQARKQRAQADKERVAAANRAKFGLTKLERESSLREKERLSKLHEGSRRELRDDDPKQP